MNLARVASVFRNKYKVYIGEERLILEITGKMRYNNMFPVVGDWVVLDDKKEAIVDILERKTKLSRKVAGKEVVEQVVAANIDYIFIVTSLNKEFNLSRLERYLSIVYESGAMPVFVLTKSDIGEEIQKKVLELEGIAFGAPIHVVNIFENETIEELRQYFKSENTIALVGSSGVGKSTLINKLLGKDMQYTKEIREKDDRGKHATTTREMFFLDRGVIIDTPGMRELQIWEADLGNSFQDIEELAIRCHFRDCAHENEPGCAVRQAVETGKISRKRLENYKKLQKELKIIENKRVMGHRRMEKEKIKNMMGSLNERKKIKNRGV